MSNVFSCPLYFLGQGLSQNLALTDLLACLCLLGFEFIEYTIILSFYIGVRNPGSGPLACLPSTLPIEPSFLPRLPFFFKKKKKYSF